MNTPSFRETALLLFATTFGVLAVASLAGAWLKRRVACGRPHGVIDNLNHRILAWWVMVALMGVAFSGGRVGVLLLFGLLSLAALREFTAPLFMAPADQPVRQLLFLAVLPLQYLMVGMGWLHLHAVFIPVLGFLVLPALAALHGDAARFLERVAQVQWALMSCVFCLSHVPALLALHVPGCSEGELMLLVAYLVIVVQGSDVLQYLWGKALGRHPVAPALSPSKTVEGLLGGTASATALGTALHGITPFTPLQSAAVAFTLCIAGFLGGLVMSGIKRDRGLKDWGDLIPGHGGVLDRLDSVVFAAPVFFYLLRWGWAA
jgi:phosphatidate cytidylyltransferase